MARLDTKAPGHDDLQRLALKGGARAEAIVATNGRARLDRCQGVLAFTSLASTMLPDRDGLGRVFHRGIAKHGDKGKSNGNGDGDEVVEESRIDPSAWSRPATGHDTKVRRQAL